MQEEMEKSQKNPKVYKGKQSVKHLVWQGAGVSNIGVQTATSNPLNMSPGNTVLIFR